MPDALILAGGRIDADFAEAVGTDMKGFIQVRGRPAVDYVMDALRDATGIGRVALVGPQEYADRLGDRLDVYCAEGSDLGANLRLGVEALGLEEGKLFVVTCEAVCLSGEVIDQFLEMCPPEMQIVYPVVSLESVEAEFPERRWIRVPLRGRRVVATNMFLIDGRILVDNEALVATIGGARKSVLRVARIWGCWFLLKLLLRRHTLDGIARHVERVTGVRGTAVLFPRAEVAMDLDAPADLDIVQAWLARREASAPATPPPRTP
jgi:GTP:adenosylcobinamide-phosphate guanylyltransferase